jgi:outer membrane protein
MRKTAIFVLLAAISSQPATAQPHQWSLRECCDYAVSHSISIRQHENQQRQQQVHLSTARNSRLPDISASAGQSFSFGRSLTADNTYSNTNTSSTSFSLGTSIPLFTGFQIPNQIKLQQLNLEAAIQDLEKAKNDIRMQVAQNYVQILYNMEMLDVARRQIAIDSMQVVRLQAMVDNGKASGVQLSQQQATLAQSRLTATQAEGTLNTSLLTLTQLLELPSADGFTIVRPSTPTPHSAPEGATIAGKPSLQENETTAGGTVGLVAAVTTEQVPSPETVYAEALGVKPEIAAQQLRLRATDNNIKIAQSGYMPTLSLSGSLGSNYYTNSEFSSDGFGRQLKNNFSQYIGLNLSIPIFNRFQTRNNVRTARIEQENQRLQLDITKKTLYKEIQQVCQNTLTAQAKYKSSATAAQSSYDAFTLMQAKYENGKANITEFNEAKNNYLRAESDHVQASYELLYQHALLQFYRGKDINF